MRRILAALAVALAALAVVGTAQAAHAPRPGYPITVGEKGRQTCDVLWLLRAQKPSRFRDARHRVVAAPMPKGYKTNPNVCTFTRADARATSVLKYRLGYSKLYLGGEFGPKLRKTLISGRSIAEIILSNKRLSNEQLKAKAVAEAAAATQAENAWKDRLVEWELREVGVHEIPDGSNYSDRIRYYQSYTGAYRLAWCVSFQQAGRGATGMQTIDNRSAGVFSVVDYARRHGLARSYPAKGFLSAFLDGAGHIGLVYKVDASGYYTVEGNHNNGVNTVFHPHHSRSVLFIEAGPTAPTGP